ncbi:nocturnin-like isoform X1 [Periophthalmus magnuspinnatus]|uniref:nocturnin-like isoform X1 n=2 Tax=Periophthalmus magnuspinnatus TaxID=409849 RepID=UPI00145B12A4|nr:nocturnin-like isoform X1 [Periophthalmus magnuspinnatus]
METMVYPMGGGATRLYSALNRPQALPEPHNNTTLDSAFCKEHRGSIVRSSDPEELLRQCEDALRDRPPRFHRKFIHIHEDGRSASSGHFRVMQWNILAQALGEGMDSFVQCPLEALSWSQRKYLILEEILIHRPHILCLQEVDHYFDTFQPVLAGLGYCSHFCPKPWSPCLDVEGNNGPDGCALFYDQSEFELLDSVNIRLSAMRIPTNQVAVVTMLRSRHNNRSVCIAVTHLKARAGWEWLRSAQGSDLLRQLQNLVQQRHSPSPASQDVPLLVCGDFNAVPSEEVYRRFTSSLLGLDSAYKKLSQDGSTEPAYTTWKIRPTGECCSTLDYIWYAKDSLRVEAVLDMPTEEQIGPNRLPSYNYPSDHLSLVCDFSFKERE